MIEVLTTIILSSIALIVGAAAVGFVAIVVHRIVGWGWPRVNRG